jgi:hypothetical protein
MMMWIVFHSILNILKILGYREVSRTSAACYENVSSSGNSPIPLRVRFSNEFSSVVPMVCGKISSVIDCNCTELVLTGLDRPLLWTDLVANSFCDWFCTGLVLNLFCNCSNAGVFVIVVLTGFRLRHQYWRHFLGSLFQRGIFPSKVDPKDFYWDTIQALSRAHAFLYT